VKIAARLKKPLYVGEFGVPGAPSDQTTQAFTAMLKLIEDSSVPLAALWVYDHGSEDPFTVTSTNARSYQLRVLGEANEGMRAAEGGQQ